MGARINEFNNLCSTKRKQPCQKINKDKIPLVLNYSFKIKIKVMTLYEYLKNDKEPMPKWLLEIKAGDLFSNKDFFSSRIVYYPGSYTDGHAVKLFGSTHSAHCFIYVDYHYCQNELEMELKRYPFIGYVNLFKIQLNESDLVPNGWIPSTFFEQNENQYRSVNKSASFAFLQILERESHLTDEHGPQRLAIIFLLADGIATYDALFCQKKSLEKPFALLIHDHGFGLAYDKFGGGGLLNRIAEIKSVIPKYLLVAENTKAWSTHQKFDLLKSDPGGMHQTPRFLYRRRRPSKCLND